MRKEFRELTPLGEAFETVDELDIETRTEKIDLEDAMGRVLSSSIESEIDVPGFDRSIMDGYAVRARDTYGANNDSPAELGYGGVVETGEEPDVEVTEFEAVEISTGGVIPRGADAVVMVEETEREGETVEIYEPVAPGDNIMRAGADVAAGEQVLDDGTRLTPREIGLLAALGYRTVEVYGKPKVGIVSTGNEIVRPGDDLSPGQIYDVNSFSTASGVEDSGGEPKIYDHASDDYDEMKKVLMRATEECDLVLSSGSTSASSADVVYRVIEQEGELILHGIALKPGKPTVFGKLNDTPYIGLPGNPISALTVFNLFASRLIRDAAGLPKIPRSDVVQGKMATSVSSEVGRTRLFPVGLVESPERGLLAYSLDKGSGATTSLSEADGYVVVDADVNYLEENENVEITLLGRNVEPPEIFGVGGGCPLLNRVLRGFESRYLARGSMEGVRKVREGIADFAGVNIGSEEIDELEVGDVKLVRGYERSVGLIYRDSSDGYGSLEDAVTEDVRIAARPRSSGTRLYMDQLLEELDSDKDDADILVFRSQDSVANAVREEKADVGVGLEHIARKHGLGFKRLKWENFDFVVSTEREEKEGMEELLGKVSNLDTRLDGYRSVDSAGETIRKW